MKWEFWNALTIYALQLLSIFYLTISPNIIVMWYNFYDAILNDSTYIEYEIKFLFADK